MTPSGKNIIVRHYGSWMWLLVVLSGAALFLFYMWFYVSVLGFDLPKTAILKRQNAHWNTRMDQMSQQLDRYDELVAPKSTAKKFSWSFISFFRSIRICSVQN